MKFTFSGETTMATDDPYYALFDGGHIKPSKFLSDQQQIECLEEAISTIREFIKQAEEDGWLEII